MRLLKIGRDATCDIVLHSDKVSALHAEITLLNSGDIMLEDKGSHNGTFIMNQQIKPNKPVNVRRGDAIRFADVELQWSQVPMPEDNSAYKGIFGIGSHFNNDIQISGATVSRYHATVKLGRDNKVYIVDHSKNGTTVDGVKISSNTPVQIKKKSVVVCGGVPADLSRLPWPVPVWRNIAGIAAAIVVLVGLGFGVYKLLKPDYSDAQLYVKYNHAVVLLVGKYHYEVTAGSLPASYLRDAGIPSKFQLYNGKLIPEGSQNYGTIFSQATGFFVSNEGHIVTNLHVAKPWLFDSNRETLEELCKELFHQYASVNDLRVMLGQGKVMLDSYTSSIKVTGVLDGITLIPQGKLFSNENAETCRVVSAGENKDVDVALLQTHRGELPSHTRFINVKDSIDVTDEALEVGKHVYTLGFPIFSSLPQAENGIQLLGRGGGITVKETEYLFGFDATSDHGASGSPIFNTKGMLVGVLNSGVSGFNYGIKAKYVKELLDGPYKK